MAAGGRVLLSYERGTGCEEPRRGLTTTAASYLYDALQSNPLLVYPTPTYNLPSADWLLCRPAEGFFFCLQGHVLNSSEGCFYSFSLVLFICAPLFKYTVCDVTKETDVFSLVHHYNTSLYVNSAGSWSILNESAM